MMEISLEVALARVRAEFEKLASTDPKRFYDPSERLSKTDREGQTITIPIAVRRKRLIENRDSLFSQVRGIAERFNASDFKASPVFLDHCRNVAANLGTLGEEAGHWTHIARVEQSEARRSEARR